MAVINTNTKALFSQTALKTTDRSMSVAMQQLSTGKRINSARDDAAGLSIVTRMTHQIRSINQAVRNAGDAVNLIQTAEGATAEINDMMIRMRELAIQASNDTNSNADRSYLDLEFQQLKQQIVQIADNTEWNGFSVLNGKAGQQVGEMPVYKVTSDNQFGSVFIQPTTSKTFAGADAGEVQEFEISGSGNGLTGSIAGIDVTSADQEPSLAHAADRIRDELNANTTAGMTASHVVPAVSTSAGGATSTDSATLTFADLKKGQSVTVAGLKFTATEDVDGTTVAGYYKNITAGTAATALSAAKGTFTGTMTDWTSDATNSTNTLVFTRKLATAAVTQGAGAVTESATITFSDLKKGESVTVAGLTFTANTDVTGTQVASNFKNITAGTAASSLTQPSNGTFTGTLGAFGSAAANTTNTLVFTSSTANSNVTDITLGSHGNDIGVGGTFTLTYSGADGDVAPAVLNVKGGDVTFSALTATTIRKAVAQATESLANTGKFLQSGSLEFSVSASAAQDGIVTAVFTTSDNERINMTGTLKDLDPATIVFAKATGSNSTVISDDLTYTLEDTSGDPLNLVATPRALTMTVGVEGSIPRLREGDLTINGVTVGPSLATDDLLSPRNNAAGSALAIAAAINRVAVTQGVSQGEIQSVTLTGTVAPGTITVGGVSVVLNANDSTPALAAAKIAAALRGSPEYGEASGRTVTYNSGSSTISIGFPPAEGDKPKLDVVAGATGLGSVVNTTQEFKRQNTGTGVFAKVNENVFSGQSMVSGPIATGTIFINGYATANIATQYNNSQATREDVVRAVNMISDKTGVRAIDTGSDAKGVQLVAADGRNIEVRFETSGTTSPASFGQRIGVREGVQSATISLESKILTPVILGSVAGGDITRAGLIGGDYSKNQAVQNTGLRPAVGASLPQKSVVRVTGSLGDASSAQSMTVVVNGKSYTSTVASGSSSTPEAVTNDLITQINADKSTLGVFATKGNGTGEILLSATTAGASFTLSATTTDSGVTLDTGEIQAAASAAIKHMGQDDLSINGVTVRASRAIDDPYSIATVSSSDPAASAIALAAAINDSTALTGVKAYANPAETAGSVTTTSDNVNGVRSLYVNGIQIDVEFVKDESGTARREKVVEAINARLGQHGVVASDNGKGVTLSTTDGRNLSVWFDSSVEHLNASDFGLSKGGEVAQQSTIKVTGTPANGSLGAVINGTAITAAVLNTDTAATAASKLADAINASNTLANLTAVAMADGSIVITSDIPGSGFDVHLPDSTSASTWSMAVSTTVSNSSGQTDVSAVNMSQKYVENVLQGTYDATTGSKDSWKSMDIRTLYGTVRMVADAAVLPTLPGPDGRTPSSLNSDGRPIVVRAGGNGFGPQSNFSALGFQEGSFGGRASTDMDPPRVGRMAFQVGAGANQYITIDLADFGKKGPITGDITGDVDLAVESRSVRINSREGAQAVLALLDGAMDKVNATRATMGAVMNRLDHVINNLNNVSMNMSASRSQIEDADYAKASTDLARAQIMQQAATAVLAQANTSQQSVLKLLGNG